MPTSEAKEALEHDLNRLQAWAESLPTGGFVRLQALGTRMFISTERLSAVTAHIAQLRAEVERLNQKLEGITTETPRIVRVTCEPDEVESWCAFASRLQSQAALALSPQQGVK